MRTIFLVILASIFITAASAQQSLRPGSIAPEFSAPALNGQLFDLNQLQGKVVVVTFWSTRCPICHSEIPKLNRVADKYKGQNVVFLGLTTDNESKVENYLKSTQFNFNILPNSFGIVLQYADRDRQGNIDIGYPAYFVINQSGSIELKNSGWDKTTEIDDRISRLLSSAQNPSPKQVALLEGQK
jgi:peroxiredoxin